MNKEDIKNWASTNNINVKFNEEYSDNIAAGGFISQSKAANESVNAGTTIIVAFSKGKEPPY